MTDDCGVDAIILVVASVVMMDVQEDNAVNDKCLLDSLFKIQKETPSESQPVTQSAGPSESIKITTPYKDPYSLKPLSMTDTEKVEFLTAKWEPFDVSFPAKYVYI
uniref:Uncharacterized protein n=1 Tax=Magallana gigas TaxID=29159 RepID=K1QRA5_MAGGI